MLMHAAGMPVLPEVVWARAPPFWGLPPLGAVEESWTPRACTTLDSFAMEVTVALSLMSKVMIKGVLEKWSSRRFRRKGKIKIDVRGLIKLNFKSSTNTFKKPKPRKPSFGITKVWRRYLGKASEEETAMWSLPSVAVSLLTRSQRTTSQL